MTELVTADVVIANGQSVSTEADFPQCQEFAVWFPAAWTAAVATVQVGLTNAAGTTTWYDVYNVAGEVSLPADAGRVVSVVTAYLPGVTQNRAQTFGHWGGKIRIRSGTGAAPVAQLGDRSIKLTFWSLAHTQ